MKRLTLLALLIACASPVPAQADDSPGKAVIITGMERGVSCIGAVAITEIDGKNVQVHPQRFEIEEGQHSMKGTASINFDYCPQARGAAARRALDRQKFEPLEGYFEAGLQYYVGFDHSSEDPDSWGYTVWKIENAQGQEVTPESQ